ncbi:MAG: ATP-dependent DNA helicase RecG [Ruminococcaceae bacterium]|nr:ATP-dependent DNA helicase RecG [Oscillospiraceae bacterium]
MNNNGSMLGRDVSCLRGVGEARKKALSKMGIETVGDLLACYPRGYQNRGDTSTLLEIKEKLIDGERGPFSAILTISSEPKVNMIRRGMVLMKVRAFDETGSVEITWFNQQYLKDQIHTGDTFRFFGRFTAERSKLQLNSPIMEKYQEGVTLPDIVPVYPLTSGLNQKFMASITAEALRLCGRELLEYMPTCALEELRLPTYAYTVYNIHRPTTLSVLESAKRRLVFDELYLLFLSMALGKTAIKKKNAKKLESANISEFLSALPFKMTGAQLRSVNEIIGNMSGETLMNRILTGDVGSGKTAVAEAAAYAAVKNGYRVALMVPTEILALQHYESFSTLFDKLGIRCACLTGSTKKRERELILSGLTGDRNRIDIVIGTHALLTEGVEICDLGLAIIDEQHRFGVNQRAALFEKAKNVHSLVMSATPIPRTLTLAAYGSIDVSRIDELPSGRQKIDTFIVNESFRDRLNGFIIKQAEEGHQTYVVCPAVEESAETADIENAANIELFGVDITLDNSVPLKAATAHADYLADTLSDLNVAFVHGKMKSAEKERVMNEFSEGNVDVLVSTTVIEVGVNVPNATLMIVENAERFGLSQLHQLRGRVGRGDAKSYFVLVSDSKNPEAVSRLRAVKSTTDGFEIAEYDLQMRGPGDFFGESGTIRQHGQMSLRLAATCRDTALIERASYYANKTLADDPHLTKESNRKINDKLAALEKMSEHTLN